MGDELGVENVINRRTVVPRPVRRPPHPCAAVAS
jgi:hypothetical protein